MNEQAQRYPLSWPAGWKRTAASARKRALFGSGRMRTKPDGSPWYRGKDKLTVAEALERLLAELGRLGAARTLISTNVRSRNDGLPHSGAAEPSDPGVAVYFLLKDAPRTLACDRWDRVADNIAAIAAHIEAIRAVDRYGVGTLEQAFAGYAALPSGAQDWWLVLGVKPTATLADVEDAYRRLAKEHHPDIGGTHDAMAKISEARENARKALAR